MRSISSRPSLKKFSPKRYDYIPYESRKNINRDQLGKLVGRVLGGSYKNAKHPWENRRIVRDILEETGHLKTIKGQTKYREKDVTKLLKDFRAELKNRRKELGFGPAERGEYFGRRTEDIYRKFVEKEYNESQKSSKSAERQQELEKRIVMARRRELQREELGLTASSVAQKITTTNPERGGNRRSDLEARLEAMRDKAHPKTGSMPAGQTAASPASHSEGGVGAAHAPLPAAAAPHSAHLHLPPRVNEAPDEANGVSPDVFPVHTVQSPTEEPAEETQTNGDEQKDEADTKPTIDENLPL